MLYVQFALFSLKSPSVWLKVNFRRINFSFVSAEIKNEYLTLQWCLDTLFTCTDFKQVIKELWSESIISGGNNLKGTCHQHFQIEFLIGYFVAPAFLSNKRNSFNQILVLPAEKL